MEEKNEKKVNEAVEELFNVIPTEKHRELLVLVSVLEDEYQARLAIALKNFVRTGKETAFRDSRLMKRLYTIGKRILGYEATDGDFNLEFYHLYGQMTEEESI